MNMPESQELKRIVNAPPPSNPELLTGVLSVECAEDEDVEWSWTETANGRFVSGYQIIPRVTIQN